MPKPFAVLQHLVDRLNVGGPRMDLDRVSVESAEPFLELFYDLTAPGAPVVPSFLSEVDVVRLDDLVAAVKAGDAKAFYARWVEFGTQKMQARPFFFPAYRALKKRVKSRINREMKKAIREGAK
jgi:hypothetical protein